MSLKSIFKLSRFPQFRFELTRDFSFRSTLVLKEQLQPSSDYVPGVRGFAPGFGTPPLKPPTAARQKKIERKLWKKARKTHQLRKELLKVKDEAPIKETPVVPKPAVQEPISFILKDINSSDESYEKKMIMVREKYNQEIKQLKEKRAIEAAENEEAERLRKIEKDLEQNRRVKELQERRTLEHLSSLNLVEDNAPIPAAPQVNPFTDPLLKSQRVSQRKARNDTIQNKNILDRKTALLKLFYGANSYITPANVNEVIDTLVGIKPAPSAPSFQAFDLNSKFTKGFIIASDMAKIKDILNDTLDGKPSVGTLSRTRSSDNNVDWITKAVEFKPTNNN